MENLWNYTSVKSGQLMHRQFHPQNPILMLILTIPSHFANMPAILLIEHKEPLIQPPELPYNVHKSVIWPVFHEEKIPILKVQNNFTL